MYTAFVPLLIWHTHWSTQVVFTLNCYIYIYICTFISIYMYMCTYIYTCMNVYIYTALALLLARHTR